MHFTLTGDSEMVVGMDVSVNGSLFVLALWQNGNQATVYHIFCLMTDGRSSSNLVTLNRITGEEIGYTHGWVGFLEGS